MRNKSKALEIERKESVSENFERVYQEAKKYSCKIELGLKEYSVLLRRALREGTTPEILVARCIAERVRDENS